jgi:hypothetical protein
MRRILVDYARARDCAKREGTFQRAEFDEALLVSTEPDPKVLRVEQALKQLAGFDSRKAQVVERRYFGGLTSALR